MIPVKVKLGVGAKMPVRGSTHAAGYDIFSSSECIVDFGKVTVVPTGLFLQLPLGTEAQIRPRSGLAAQYGLTVVNTPGTVDCDYRGEVKLLLTLLKNDGPIYFTAGTRLAQLVVKHVERVEFEDVDVIDGTERGSSGFGSTGLKDYVG